MNHAYIMHDSSRLSMLEWRALVLLPEFSVLLAVLVLPVAAGEFASLEDEHWSITEAGDGGGAGVRERERERPSHCYLTRPTCPRLSSWARAARSPAPNAPYGWQESRTSSRTTTTTRQWRPNAYRRPARRSVQRSAKEWRRMTAWCSRRCIGWQPAPAPKSSQRWRLSRCPASELQERATWQRRRLRSSSPRLRTALWPTLRCSCASAARHQRQTK